MRRWQRFAVACPLEQLLQFAAQWTALRTLPLVCTPCRWLAFREFASWLFHSHFSVFQDAESAFQSRPAAAASRRRFEVFSHTLVQRNQTVDGL